MNIYTRSVPAMDGHRGQVVLRNGNDMLGRDGSTEVVLFESDVWGSAEEAKGEADEVLTDTFKSLFRE